MTNTEHMRRNRSALTRRDLSVALALGLAGCLDRGDDDNDEPDETVADNPALSAATKEGDLRLTSSLFDDGERIPDEYGYEEPSVNPPIEIGGVSDDAESLVLVMDDLEAGATVDDLGAAMNEHIIARTQMTGTDAP